MRTLTMNEMQVVSGAGPESWVQAPVVYTTNDMISALTFAPAPWGIWEAYCMMSYNTYAAAQFGLANIVAGAASILDGFFN